jgi:hypothetical protein
LVNYFNLFVYGILLLFINYKINKDILASVLGFLIVVSSRGFLFNFLDPYLTDVFTLNMINCAILSLLDIAFLPFTISVLLGVLSRETLLPITFAWGITRQWKQFFFILSATLLTFFIPRLLLPSNINFIDYVTSTFEKIGFFKSPFTTLFDIFLSWGYVWTVLIGLLFLPKNYRASLWTVFILLLGFAFLSSLIATDKGRMFEILAPIFSIAGSSVIHELRKMGGGKVAYLITVLTITCVFQLFTLFPTTLYSSLLPIWFRLFREVAGMTIYSMITILLVFRLSRTHQLPFNFSQIKGSIKNHASSGFRFLPKIAGRKGE